MEKSIVYNDRVCDCCGGRDHEEMWVNEHMARTRNGLWPFKMRNIICRRCGFVFVSPAPTKGCIDEYYGDSYAPYDKQVTDYDVDKRMEFISTHTRSGSSCIEIGGIKGCAFAARLSSVFGDVSYVQLNDEISSDYRTLENAPRNLVDTILHYYVLEHVPYVAEFMAHCYERLNPDGVMLCEMPDIRVYPNDISAMLLHEHVNHFSVGAISRIARKAGFEMIEKSHDLCSRPYGVALAFRTAPSAAYDSSMIDEYEANKRFIEGGLVRLSAYEQLYATAKKRLDANTKKGGTTVLWGANDNMLRFINSTNGVPSNVVMVDSNPAKKQFVKGHDVYQAEEVKDVILKSDIILIFSRINSSVILDSIKSNYGKTFNDDNILIVDL